MQDQYPSSGIGIGPAMTFGYEAGQHIALALEVICQASMLVPFSFI